MREKKINLDWYHIRKIYKKILGSSERSHEVCLKVTEII